MRFDDDINVEMEDTSLLWGIDKREVDFVVMKNKKPLFAVECKKKIISPHIRYFKERTTIPLFYHVHLGHKSYQPESYLKVMPFCDFCKEAKLV